LLAKLGDSAQVRDWRFMGYPEVIRPIEGAYFWLRYCRAVHTSGCGKRGIGEDRLRSHLRERRFWLVSDFATMRPGENNRGTQCEGCRRRPCESGESLPQVSMLLGWRAESTETHRPILNLPRVGAMQEC
jgi:hypothetical protein